MWNDILPTHHELRRFKTGTSPQVARRRCRKALAHASLGHKSRKSRLQAWQTHTPSQRHRKSHNLRPDYSFDDDRDDGRRLAADHTVVLPGAPRLERQEAFRAPRSWSAADTDIVVDDADLYRMGLLYDDEEEGVQAPDFCLNSIIPSEPSYLIRRGKHRGRAARKQAATFLHREDLDLGLSVNLLSAYLSDDTDLARFLAVPMIDDNEEHAQLYHEVPCGYTVREAMSNEPALTVIYELENSTHSSESTTTAAPYATLLIPSLLAPPDLEDCDKSTLSEEEEDLLSELDHDDWALVTNYEHDDDDDELDPYHYHADHDHADSTIGDALMLATPMDDLGDTLLLAATAVDCYDIGVGADTYGEDGSLDVVANMATAPADDDAWIVLAGDDS
ncbi:hypothetical protein F5Y16DRAFT_156249 [Xylariaceae sp. FL0255]|nr:hypothetical protein F5Y16DRAFT_156249 [Xylariaceae sp. FL0255]